MVHVDLELSLELSPQTQMTSITTTTSQSQSQTPLMKSLELIRISAGSLKIPGNLILEGLDKSHELYCPDYAFLIKHDERLVLWDTGLSRDLSIYPPAAQKYMPTFKRMSVMIY